MKILEICLEEKLFAELQSAAAITGCDKERPATAKAFAQEVVESFLAARRLARMPATVYGGRVPGAGKRLFAPGRYHAHVPDRAALD